MARDFDGANDSIGFGSNDTIDAFTAHTISLWIFDDAGVTAFLIGKDRGAAQWGLLTTGNELRYTRDFTTTDGAWVSPGNGMPAATLHYIVFVYDGTSSANDPTIYIDGVSVTVTRSTAPDGTAVSDATPNLIMGETGGGAQDFNGRLGFLSYINGLWTAAQANRARWWGRPGGAQAVYHPLVTTKLTNEGTATANGTATGTTVSSLPRVQRNYCSMLGCGR